jgi:hypothetical protein
MAFAKHCFVVALLAYGTCCIAEADFSDQALLEKAMRAASPAKAECERDGPYSLAFDYPRAYCKHAAKASFFTLGLYRSALVLTISEVRGGASGPDYVRIRGEYLSDRKSYLGAMGALYQIFGFSVNELVNCVESSYQSWLEWERANFATNQLRKDGKILNTKHVLLCRTTPVDLIVTVVPNKSF